MTSFVTPEEARRYYRTHVDEHTAKLVQQLSLYPEDSPVHTVEKYGDGVRVPVYLSGDLVIYVYCLPWQRGWAIFASPLDQDVAVFSWRTVPQRWRSFQMPVYNPRDQLGPWNTPIQQIAPALEYIVRRVASIDKRRRAQLRARKNQV